MKVKFSERLRLLRTERGMTQAALAKALDLSQSTIAKWEQRAKRVKLHYLYQLVNLFNVSLDYLIGMSDDRKHKRKELIQQKKT